LVQSGFSKSKSLSILEEKICNLKASVGVIGLGHVGLPLCLLAAEAGFKVIGYDVDSTRVSALKAQDSYLTDVDASRLAGLVSANRFFPTSDPADLVNTDVVVICVPTPLTPNQVPDLTYINEANSMLQRLLKPGMLIVLESTTYPGCTREVLKQALEQEELEVGKDIWLAFSPERVDPGCNRDIAATPKLVGGITKECTQIASLFYSKFINRLVPLSSTEVAEMAKLLENIYRSVNIALVNELAVICNRMGISIWEVIEAASTKPFGFTPFYPGPGMGGHCIPIDPFYLSWKARELGLVTEFIELAGKVNTRMPSYVVERIVAALNEHSKCMRGSSILLLGAAYKANVSDLRESPAIRVAELLLDSGAVVSYHDPHVPRFSAGGRTFKNQTLTNEALSAADCVVALTAHSAIDWEKVAKESQLVVDTRNVVPSIDRKILSI
jgi:UDP-N-acetyl-D-glucosamine dehydrogenase